MQNEYMLSEDEIQAAITKGTKKAKLSIAIAAMGILFAFLAFALDFQPLIYIGVLIICGAIAVKTSADNAVKSVFSTSVIPLVLNKTFDEVDYHAGLGIDESIVRNTDMNFQFRYDKIKGEDLVIAKYKGLDIQMSDITIITTEVVHTKDGTRHRDVTNFKGTWLICDFGKQIRADLVLSEKKGLDSLFKGKGLKTDSESFNKQFYIKTDSDHDAFYILTPHMMEYIQGMDRAAEGNTHMHFMRNGVLHIAVNSNRDSFKVNVLNQNKLEEIKENFQQDLKYITNIIDELRLADNMYVK